MISCGTAGTGSWEAGPTMGCCWPVHYGQCRRLERMETLLLFLMFLNVVLKTTTPAFPLQQWTWFHHFFLYCFAITNTDMTNMLVSVKPFSWHSVSLYFIVQQYKNISKWNNPDWNCPLVRGNWQKHKRHKNGDYNTTDSNFRLNIPAFRCLSFHDI